VRGLRIDGPVPESGAVVRASGAEVGRVTSAAADPALGAIALAPLARAVEPGAAVTVESPSGEVGATVAELPLR
jgi:glycine cleavage system aminomethyltransferase T